ncbi:MAG: hypothetical protein KC421_07400 [Anaerolineales bacterium]|nr:hypothetical protein [Anaerolineales bacterium]
MNKQTSKRFKPDISLERKPFYLRSQMIWIGLVTGVIITAVFVMVTAVRAQTNTVQLSGGESVDVLCEGRGFQIERVSRREINLICQAGSQTQPTPTAQPPVDPTNPPPQPTVPPPQPPPTAPAPGTPVANVCQTVTGLMPLNDLGSDSYQGFQGGLYPGGTNAAPADYLNRAMQAVNNINTNEPFVLLSIGMSNTMREFETFQQVADADTRKNPNLIIINGAQTSQDSATISDPNADYWAGVDSKLTQIRLTPDDVRVVWLKEAHARPDLPFPQDAQQLQAETAAIIDILNTRYPNLEIIYLSSRIYAGYATNDLNPEPYAYQGGFAVKWLIEEKMSDPQYTGPALLWGPYMWADGLTPRSDGLTWACDDFKNDMTHPSELGKAKVANLLLDFFTTDETAVWFTNK